MRAGRCGSRTSLIRSKLALAYALTTALCPHVSQAETADSAPLDEIIVTAIRRDTKLLETPVSLTVIGTETLKTENIDAVSDFERLVPGLTAIDSGPGQKRYALRGLQSAGEPEVALYYDDIPISGLPGGSLDTGDDQLDLKLWDVDRIEVLRGPQGTLYGDGSMGGAIRILSKRPELDHFRAAAEVTGGATEGGGPSWGASGMVNAPLIEGELAVRATFYDRYNGGWIDEIARSNIDLPQHPGDGLNWEHTWGSRVAATFKASDQWALTAIAYYQKLQTGNSFETYPSFALTDDPYVTQAFVRTPWNDQSALAELNSTYNLGWASLVATGTYQNRFVDQNLDTTRFLLNVFGCTVYSWDASCFGPPDIPAISYAHEGVASYSGEARLISERPGPLQWTAGAFLQHASTYRDLQVAIASLSGSIDIDPGTGVAANRLFARSNHDKFDQEALYAEGTYKLTQRLSVTAGARWFNSYRSDQQTIQQQFFPGQPVGQQPFQSFSEKKLFKKFELSYALAPKALLYVQAAQGFRAGGPNYPGGFTTTAPPYHSDSVWAYELGWKVASEGDRVLWSGDLFHINWSNVQQLVPTKLFSYIVNAGSAQSDGFEMEVEGHATRHWTVGVGLSYVNARLVGPQPLSSNPTTQLASGDRFGGVPDWTASSSASYRTPIGPRLSLVGRLDYTYQSGRSSVTAVHSPAYFLIDRSNLTGLHLLLESSQSWSVGLHVNNLFNEFIPLSGKALDSNLIHTITAARPRTGLLTLSTQF